MTEIERHLIQQFYDWEVRGRGWISHPQPVTLEPPFRPFSYRLPQARLRNAGQMPTLLSSMVSAVSKLLIPKNKAVSEEFEIEEPAAELFQDSGEPVVELQMSLPPKCGAGKETMESFLRTLSVCRGPVALEYAADETSIVVQWAAAERDANSIESQFANALPEAVLRKGNNRLPALFDSSNVIGISELGLDMEFLVPLTTFGKLDPDPLLPLIAIFGSLREREGALYQILFQPARHRWADNMRACVSFPDGSPMFANAPELVEQVGAKVASPLFAVVVRLVVGGDNERRCDDLLRELTNALSVFGAREGCNRLVPLRQRDGGNEENFAEVLNDILERRTRRSGMILNLDELVSLAHLPAVSIRTPRLVRQMCKTKAAPPPPRGGSFVLGENEHAGWVTEIILSNEDRVRHMHVLGASGTGKSTLLLNAIVQDICSGQGVAVLDPHGDLVDKIIGFIPPDRIGDVILFDPSDEEYPVGFNILSAHSDLERTLIASDLCAVFRRQSTSWGDNMTTVLSNAILAFLESSRGGTLGDLRRFLIESDFRKSFLKTVRDPEVLYFWERNFPHITGKPQASIVTRLDAFLRPKAVRYMVCQKDSRLDFSEIMDTGKIFLAKLPQGLIGQENAHLFGTLLVSKFQQMAIARQAMASERRRDFWLYIDECHHFATPSMGDILTGSRKYRLGLILAHQELRQLLSRDAEVGSAVLANPAVRVCFRLGEEDARKMAEGFSFFDAADLLNLGIGEAIGRIGRSDHDFNLRVPKLREPDHEVSALVLDAVRENTRRCYAKPRDEVAAMYLRANEWNGETERKETRATRPVKKTESHEPPVREVETTAEFSQVIESEPPENVAEELTVSETTSANFDNLRETPGALASTDDNITSPSEELPKLADVLAEFPAVAISHTEVPENTEPRPLGRGGLEHQHLQRYLKEVGERFGYRATIEKTIGGGSVDVLLERDDKTFALEISITTGSEHEAQNLEKCLAANFDQVIAIGNNVRKLARLQTTMQSRLTEEQFKRIIFHTADSFIASLAGNKAVAVKGKRKVRGYEVTTTGASGNNATGNADQVVHDAVAKALRRLKKKR